MEEEDNYPVTADVIEREEFDKLSRLVSNVEIETLTLRRDVDTLMKLRARKERTNPFVREEITKQQKTILELHRQGMTQKKIAEKTGIKQGNISRTLKRLTEIGLVH